MVPELDTNSDEPNNPHLYTMVRQVLGWVHTNKILTRLRPIKFVSAHARIGKVVSWSIPNGIIRLLLEMRRIKETFHGRRSPVPPLSVAEGSRTSTSSNSLASVIKGLDVAEKAVVGLPIVKPVISTIRTVLQSVEVKIIHYLHLG